MLGLAVTFAGFSFCAVCNEQLPRGWAIVSHISAHIFSNQTCLNKKKCLLKSKKRKTNHKKIGTKLSKNIVILAVSKWLAN